MDGQLRANKGDVLPTGAAAVIHLRDALLPGNTVLQSQKNKSSLEKVRLFFNFEAPNRYDVWLRSFDVGIFLSFKWKTNGLSFFRL